jgi:cysteine synthase A
MVTRMLGRSQKLAQPLLQAGERRTMLGAMTRTAAAPGMDIGFPMSMFPPSQETPMPNSSVKFPMPFLPQAPVTTPLPAAEVAKQPTPLMQVLPNMYAKLEGFNAGGSIKDRAVMQCVMGMLESGKLKSGDTMCLCTSGNAGRALLFVQEKLAQKGIEIKVKIFMPRRYLTRDQPKAIAETDGVEVVHGDRESSFYSIPHAGEMSRFLHGLDAEFIDCQKMMTELAKEYGWATLDQHYDVNSLHAHQSTAEELISQLPGITDVVCTTGTGGTAAGLRKYLPAHVNVHARPAKPGAIDGITDVRRYSNFCDVGLLAGFSDNFFDKEECVKNMKELQSDFNITAGESSGATYGLAKDILSENPEAQVVFICADGSTSTKTLHQSQLVSLAE